MVLCGIVGYTGSQATQEFLLNGLHRLEYRGYDSAGICVQLDDELVTYKKQGKVAELEAIIPDLSRAKCGIGHTRWATHGEPNDINAHPHHDSTGQLALVHNGIIENHAVLREFLTGKGRRLKSETDSEVLVEYISLIMDEDGVEFSEAVRRALTKVVGAYGLVVMHASHPGQLIAARLGSPLVIGVGDNEQFIASDATPLIEHTRNVVYLEDGEMAVVNPSAYEVWDIRDKSRVEKTEQEVVLTLEQIEKGGYPHFMLKEIMEQDDTIVDALRGRIDLTHGIVTLGGIPDDEPRLLNADLIYLTACGTSWHAALIGSYLIEDLVGIPTKVEYASEFRYRQPILGANTTLVAISQSGETADTLAAVKRAKDQGALTLGIVNVVGSSISRETHCGVFIHAGPEIGVASTKAFTSQVTVLVLLAILLAQRAGKSPDKIAALITGITNLQDKVQDILGQSAAIRELAGEYKDCSNFLYLGRGFQFPVALEGALKLKEISYIHAEGYPAAEMKHGPIALIDEHMPVVVIAMKDRTYDKILANIQEIRARRGRVIAIANERDPELERLADHIIYVPHVHPMIQPLLAVIPLQLLAYHIAELRDCHIDQPRNLAKSVTVE